MAQVSAAGIPTIDPSTTAPDAYQHIQASPDAFGAGIGAATQVLGQGTQNAGMGAFKVGEQYDEVAADNALNQFQERIRHTLRGNPDAQVGPDGNPPPGFMSLQGQEAMRARPEIQKQIDAAQKEIGGTLKNPGAQQRFAHASSGYKNSAFNEVDAHTDAQAKEWYKQVNSDTAKNAMQDIAVHADNDLEYDKYREDLRAARVKNVQLAGLSGSPAAVREALDSADRDALKTRTEAIAVNDPVRAMDILNKNKAQAGVYYDELSAKFRERKEQQVGTSAATTTMAMTAIASRQPTLPDGMADKVHDAIIGQESSANPNAPPSVAGAIGIGQIMPDTFARYAKPGETIDNPEDNKRVSKRITDEYFQKYDGDAARVAVAYFSGEGNVAAPGSPTPWIADRADKTGKTVSSYVTDVNARVGDTTTPLALHRLSSNRADALKTISDNPDLNDREKSIAFAKIEQTYRIQTIATEQDAKAKKDANDTAADGYVKATLKPGPIDATLLTKITDDPNLNWETRRSLGDAVRAQSGSDYESAQRAYGPGFWDVYKAVNLPSGADGRITDISQVLSRAGQGGDLTLAGVQKIQAELSQRRTAEGSAATEMKNGAMAYAKSQLSFELQIGNFKLPDPIGMGDFNTKFIPAFYKAYDDGIQAGKTPYALLSKDSPDFIVDKLVSTYKRTPAQIAKDRINAQDNILDGAADASKYKTPDDLRKAVADKKITRDAGVQIAIDKGWARKPEAAPARAVEAPRD